MFNTRVLCVSEDPVSRTGLSTIVLNELQLDLSGQLDPASLNKDVLDVFQPDVILWDLGWGSMSDVSSQIETPIVLLYHPSQESELFQQENIMGFVSRASSPEQITAALIAIHHGLQVSDLPNQPPVDFEEDWSEELTVREIDVLKLIAEGRTNRSIAAELGITEYTVKFHVNSILGKLSAESRTEAAMKAVRRGIIPL
jgi:DNA-binding NarL/FixJ family response regulator